MKFKISVGLYLFFCIVTSSPSAFASLPSPSSLFEGDTCNNVDQVSNEMIQLELAGYRWSGGDSPCLKQNQFKTIKAEKYPKKEKFFATPEYLLPEKRTVKIVQQRWDDVLAQMTLSIHYLAEKEGKDVQVQDEFTYQMNFGVNRVKGCASIVTDLKHFVMRKSCAKS